MTKVQDNPIKEAERYLENSRQILSEKAGKDGNYYNDPKYVRMAGRVAWQGVRAALDGLPEVKAKREVRRQVRFEDYMEAVTQCDPKMSKPLFYTHETLQKVLIGDGNLSCGMVESGMNQAKEVIDWADREYRKQHP